jgi:hypothetical protein
VGKRQTVNIKADWTDWEEREALRQRCKLFGYGDPVPLVYLSRDMCRFPVEENAKAVGGYLFCGRPTAAGEVYCREHLAVTNVAVRGR